MVCTNCRAFCASDHCCTRSSGGVQKVNAGLDILQEFVQFGLIAQRCIELIIAEL